MAAQTEPITFDAIKHNEDIREYIRRADRNLAAMGYTKHAFGHVTKVAEGAAEILSALGYDERTVELASSSPGWECPPRRWPMWSRPSATTTRAPPSR